MPLNVFLDCLYDNEYEGLIIKGEADFEQLKQAWDKIYLEYARLVNDGSFNEFFEVTKEINYLTAKIFLIENIIQHLRICFDESLIRILNDYGLKCKVVAEDKGEELEKKLKDSATRAKRFLTELDLKKADLEKIKAAKTEEQGRYYFHEILSAFSRNDGYAVKETDISVLQFCRNLKRMEDQHRKQAINAMHK